MNIDTDIDKNVDTYYLDMNADTDLDNWSYGLVTSSFVVLQEM